MLPPPYKWLRETVGIDMVAGRPVFVLTSRVRGQLSHRRLDDLPSQQPFHTIGCLGNSESIVRRLEAPFTSLYKARRVFPALLDLRLPFPESECESVFLDTRPVEGGVGALAVAARRQSIEARLAAYVALGSDPLSLDQESLAFWTQSLLEKPPASGVARDAVQIVIALREKRHTLCIGAAGKLLASGNPGSGVVADVDRRLKALDIDDDRTLDVRWTGPAASNAEWVVELQEAFKSVRPASAHTTHDDPDTMLARALTTRAMTAGTYRCNLRGERLAHPALRKRLLNQSTSSAAIACLTGICLLATGMFWSARNAELDNRLRAGVASRAEAVIGSPTALRGEDAVAEARRRVETVRRQTQPFADLLPAAATAGTIAVIEFVQHHGIALHELEFQQGEFVRLDGTADSWAKATALAGDLRAEFGPVAVRRQWDVLTDNDKVRFFIETDANRRTP